MRGPEPAHRVDLPARGQGSTSPARAPGLKAGQDEDSTSPPSTAPFSTEGKDKTSLPPGVRGAQTTEEAPPPSSKDRAPSPEDETSPAENLALLVSCFCRLTPAAANRQSHALIRRVQENPWPGRREGMTMGTYWGCSSLFNLPGKEAEEDTLGEIWR